ncbi:MAG: hypothetical protein WC292_07365 [Clostridia bacterium]
MNNKTDNKKTEYEGKLPSSTDYSQSVYLAAFSAAWRERFGEDEGQPYVEERALVDSDVVSPPKNATAYGRPAPRKAFAVLVLIFSLVALAIIALSHFEVLPEYSKFSFLNIKEILTLFSEPLPECWACKVANYAMPIVLIGACVFLLVSAVAAIITIVSGKNFATILPFAALILSITIFAWLFIKGEGKSIGFVKFATPATGKVLWGYYAFVAAELLAYLSSVFVNRKAKR